MKYPFLDGVNFKMRIGGSVEQVPVLVANGVTLRGHKKVLGFQSGDKEPASSRRQFIKDLKARGLSAEHVVLAIMDGLKGLEKLFRERFIHAKVHMRSIFYASSKQKALEFFETFKQKEERKIPLAVKSLENSRESCQ